MLPEFTPSEAWITRFWSRVDRSGGPDACWPWLRKRDPAGYGFAHWRGREFRAHRVAYFLTHGRWPEPLGRHRCDNPACANPAHILPGTHADNMADKAERGRAPAGEEHWQRRHPEWRLTGDDHWTRERPERLARDERHGSKTCPGSTPSGAGHYRTCLCAADVRAIRRRYEAGETAAGIALDFDLTSSAVYRIVHRRTWAHVK